MDNERDAVPDKFKCLSILKPVDPKVQTEVSQAIRDIQSYVDEKDREAEMMSLTKRDRAFIREDGIIVINWCYQNEIVLDKGDMAELKRLACKCIELSFRKETKNYSQDELLLLIKVNFSAAKALDVVGKTLASESCFQQAKLVWESSQETKPSFFTSNANLGLELYQWQAQRMWRNKRYPESLQNSKNLLSLFNNVPTMLPEVLAVAMWIYNCGIAMVRKDYYEAAREWLHLSYQVLELDQQDPDYARRQSRTLRTLAYVLIKLANWDDATSAAERAMSKNPCADGLFLQTKIFILTKKPQEAEEGIFELLKLNDCSLEMGLTICDLAADLSWKLAVNGFDALSGKYPNDAAIQDSIFSAKLRVLLASKEIQQAEELLDDYVEKHNISPDARFEIMSTLWSISCVAFEATQYNVSLKWLLKAVAIADDTNKVKLLRGISLCYAKQENYRDALNYVDQATKLGDNDPMNLLYGVLWNFALDKPGDAETILRTNDCKFSAEMWTLVADDARKVKGASPIVVLALEGLLEKIDETDLNPVVIYENLIDLSMADLQSSSAEKIDGPEKPEEDSTEKTADVTKNIAHVTEKTAEQKSDSTDGTPPKKMQDIVELPTIESKESFLSERVGTTLLSAREKYIHTQYFEPMIALLHEIKEKDANSKLLDDESLHWLASNAWNLGLRTAKALQFLATSKIMSSSYELFSMIKDDDKVGILKTRCLIVSAGARIEAALLSELKSDEQKQRAREAYTSLKELQKLPKADSEQIELIKLLEIKCKILMEDPRLASAIQALPDLISSEGFNVIGQLCANFDRRKEAADAFRKSIQLDLKELTVDVGSVSDKFCKMISIAPTNALFGMYDEAIEFGRELATDNKSFPKEYSQWLVANAWNEGVLQFRLKKWALSEKYLAKGIDILNTLLPNAESQRNDLQKAYSYVIRQLAEHTASSQQHMDHSSSSAQAIG